MPHATLPALDSMMAATSVTPGTAMTKRDSRTDLPSHQWKRSSGADFVWGPGVDDMSNRQPGDRSSLGQYNPSKHRTQRYEDQLRYKDGESGSLRDRVQRDSPLIAELRTNVIIKDEFTLVTDLSYHLAQRYGRPDSSIMIKVDHSACLALGGTFDPCYVLTLTALPSQMSPTLNKRNAALIQAFMADILSVPSDRGVVKFQPIEEHNFAVNGITIQGQLERLDKHQSESTSGAVQRAGSAARKSMPSNRKSMQKLDTDVRATNGAHTPNGTTPTPDNERKRNSISTPPVASALPPFFELPATEPADRPATSHGTAFAAENGLRMNGISKEDLNASRPNKDERPKTFAGPTAQTHTQTQTKHDPMPGSLQRHASQRTRSAHPNGTTPTSARPDGMTPTKSETSTRPKPNGPTTKPLPVQPNPSRAGSTYLDPLSSVFTSTNPSKRSTASMTTSTTSTGRVDPKLDARAAEKNGSRTDAGGANVARRRSTASTTTAIPKIPSSFSPPPMPEDSRSVREREMARVGKKKSFLRAFSRRSGVA